jgi:hypothetical protein
MVEELLCMKAFRLALKNAQHHTRQSTCKIFY